LELLVSQVTLILLKLLRTSGNNLGGARVGGDLEAAGEFTLFLVGLTTDGEVTQDVAGHRFERLSCVTVLGSVRRTLYCLLNFFSRGLLFLSILLICTLNIFKILKELLIFDCIQNVQFILENCGIVCCRNFKWSNWIILNFLLANKWRERRLVLNKRLLDVSKSVWLRSRGLELILHHHSSFRRRAR